MKISSAILIFSAFIFSSCPLLGQSKLADSTFIVVNSGDTLMTSKVYTKQTNEDKVSFQWEGNKRILKANEMKFYFNKNLKKSIVVSPNNESKLVNIILKGSISLAKSKSHKGNETIYLSWNQKWIRLDRSSSTIKTQISQLVPDFNNIIADKVIYYDLVSVGNNVSKYNETVDPNYQMVGKFEFSDKSRLGFYTAAGPGFIKNQNFGSQLNISKNFVMGLSIHTKYNRLLSGMVQVGYAFNDLSTEGFDLLLKTLDVSPTLLFSLYNRPGPINLSLGVGLNFNLNLNSKLNSTASFFPLRLTRLRVGYELHVINSINNKIDVFASFQYRPSQGKSRAGFLGTKRNLLFDHSIIKAGVSYYFKRF